ncbi:hypothetical protein EV426DRAFT_617751 [Tirmania nivea]|nr:hypothetical protein EV426DRAFT_617751 [Tirmania nivea]
MVGSTITEDHSASSTLNKTALAEVSTTTVCTTGSGATHSHVDDEILAEQLASKLTISTDTLRVPAPLMQSPKKGFSCPDTIRSSWGGICASHLEWRGGGIVVKKDTQIPQCTSKSIGPNNDDIAQPSGSRPFTTPSWIFSQQATKVEFTFKNTSDGNPKRIASVSNLRFGGDRPLATPLNFGQQATNSKFDFAFHNISSGSPKSIASTGKAEFGGNPPSGVDDPVRNREPLQPDCATLESRIVYFNSSTSTSPGTNHGVNNKDKDDEGDGGSGGGGSGDDKDDHAGISSSCSIDGKSSKSQPGGLVSPTVETPSIRSSRDRIAEHKADVSRSDVSSATIHKLRGCEPRVNDPRSTQDPDVPAMDYSGPTDVSGSFRLLRNFGLHRATVNSLRHVPRSPNTVYIAISDRDPITKSWRMKVGYSSVPSACHKEHRSCGLRIEWEEFMANGLRVEKMIHQVLKGELTHQSSADYRVY